MSERDGEYIDLYWDDYPDEYVVRGHVTDEVFAAAVRAHEEDGFGKPRHAWALWAQTGNSRAEGLAAELRVYDAPGRGRFRVTVAESYARQEARARAAEWDAKRAALNAAREARP